MLFLGLHLSAIWGVFQPTADSLINIRVREVPFDFHSSNSICRMKNNNILYGTIIRIGAGDPVYSIGEQNMGTPENNLLSKFDENQHQNIIQGVSTF
jgi:hypothetical protein